MPALSPTITTGTNAGFRSQLDEVGYRWDVMKARVNVTLPSANTRSQAASNRLPSLWAIRQVIR